MLHKLHTSFPHIPLYCLVDWNPAGLHILLTYKFGSTRSGLEAPKYACDVKWLGIRSGDLLLVPEHGLQPLTPRDIVLGHNLLHSEKLLSRPAYRDEMRYMQDRGLRAEIESLHANGDNFLAEYIGAKIMQGDYI